MSAVYVIEWTFSPPDYFEQSISIERDDYEMWIERGKVEARVKEEHYDDEHQMRDQLHEFLNDRLLGVQLLIHQPYELSIPIDIHQNQLSYVTLRERFLRPKSLAF